jgi:hypothetical protein
VQPAMRKRHEAGEETEKTNEAKEVKLAMQVVLLGEECFVVVFSCSLPFLDQYYARLPARLPARTGNINSWTWDVMTPSYFRFMPF